MTATNYTVYNGATPQVFSLDPTDTMADVRTALGGFMASTDNFLYENTVTELKTVLTPVSAEAEAKLSGCQFPPVPGQVTTPIIQIVSTSATSPSFMGNSPSTGYVNDNPQFGIRCVLNDTDAAAVTNNAGMFQPVMLENVVSCNPVNPANFTYAMICQKGAIVAFDISCWGAAGYGYTVTSAMSTSTDINADGLYILYDSDFGLQTNTQLRRYNTKAGDTIQIEANKALHISTQYNVAYSTITFSGWSMSSWTDMNGNPHSSSLPIPSLSADTDGGFQPGPPAGGSDIPGGTTQPAAPTAGPPSNQVFGGFETGTPLAPAPSTRSAGLVGSIELFCLVFDSDADAKAVIKVLNSGASGFG